MKASRQLKVNIDALLRARGQTRKDLAMYCRRTESWLSQIFRERHTVGERERGIRLEYLDQIADFFGLYAYQLFQPGISPLTERRHKERRSGKERRRLPRPVPIRHDAYVAATQVLRSLDPADLEQARVYMDGLRSRVGEGASRLPDTSDLPADTGTATRKPQRKQGHG